MKKSELQQIIKEEIDKVLNETFMSPANKQLKDEYVNAWIFMSIDPIGYQYRDNLFTTKALPNENEIVAHAKQFGYFDALIKAEREIDEMPEVEATHTGNNVAVSTFRSNMSKQQQKKFVNFVIQKLSPGVKRQLGIK
jgi:hypothetical protein